MKFILKTYIDSNWNARLRSINLPRQLGVQKYGG